MVADLWNHWEGRKEDFDSGILGLTLMTEVVVWS